MPVRFTNPALVMKAENHRDCRLRMFFLNHLKSVKTGVVMKIAFRKSVGNRYVFPLVFLLILLGTSPLAFCLESQIDQRNQSFELSRIKDKGDYGVLINGHQYRVTESTLIFDLMGKEIPLCDLPVPCKALVEVQETEGVEPEVLRIEVRRLLENTHDKG